jgi:hypothetical protein
MHRTHVGLDARVGGGENFGGGELGDDLACFEEDNALGEVEGLVEIVRYEQDGLSDAGEEVAEHGLHLGAGDGIESAERLVQEEDGGIGSECAGEADALTLASAKLPRVPGAEFGEVEADQRENFGDTRLAGGGWLAS